MGFADQFRGAWDRMTGKSPEQPAPAQPRQDAKPPPQREPPPTHDDLRRARGKEPGPAERFSPANAEKLREAARHKQQPEPTPKPAEREAAKMEYTRTAQPAPSPGGMGYVNRTSTFRQQQEAKAAEQPARGQSTPDTPGASKLAAWRRDDTQAAEKQKAADQSKAPDGASKLASFRRPGQAPDYNPDRAQAEQRMVDQFKRQFEGPSQERSR